MAEETPPAPPTGPLAGPDGLSLSFVITGTLTSMPRSRAEELIRGLGGATSDSVTRKTDYLVTGGAPATSSRRQSSTAHFLTEQELLDLLRKHGAI